MDSLKFEWDEAKNASNQKKHGISFNEAKSVFSDELGRLIPDPDHSENEERFILMGISHKNKLLTVCHCERKTNTIRIISARKADKYERKQYEG
ncbi:MAG: BrnT family toxin [gamma proteobacterium endosymbiont of Lamellibrachia anaximandri]|nr:BrnT family toxin [gamma proteobacterium endosymbiont of Lamellibrachia anaximandri]MBL3535811.1 BrnT family toxin [gamma proteobacterium endosymbiont of Lamellibrachia anaximandri]